MRTEPHHPHYSRKGLHSLELHHSPQPSQPPLPVIAVLGPNPAWQKTLFFERFSAGEINRAVEMQVFPAGKGINFCRASACHGAAHGALIQFTGGENGARIRAELEREGMEAHSVITSGATRCCSTCLCRATGGMTEVIEPSHAADTAEVEAILQHFAARLENADAAAFCGTLPTGTDPELYPKAARLMARRPVPLLLDTFHHAAAIMGSGVPVMLKINRDELRALTGQTGVEAGLRAVFRHPALRYAAITDGPHRAYASDGRRLYEYTLPLLKKVVNPIGCGDTASAVWLGEILTGTDPFEAFRTALGAASANCLNAFPGHFVPAEAAAIAPKITVSISDL